MVETALDSPQQPRIYVQIDLETLSLKQHNCPVLTVGACAYSYDKGVFSEFKMGFELDEQFRKGRFPSESTLRWWINQTPEAKQGLDVVNTGPIDQVEDELYEWWTRVRNARIPNVEPYVLSNGANFDIAILEILFENVPWHYKNVMCFRMMGTLWKGHYEWRTTKETKHDALEDAKAQADVHLQLMEKFPILR